MRLILFLCLALAGCGIQPVHRDYNYDGPATLPLHRDQRMLFDSRDISTEGWHINRYYCADERTYMICDDDGLWSTCRCVG